MVQTQKADNFGMKFSKARLQFLYTLISFHGLNWNYYRLNYTTAGFDLKCTRHIIHFGILKLVCYFISN